MRHERVDNEVIAIDLESGAYFALDDVAADCWSILAAGGAVDAVDHPVRAIHLARASMYPVSAAHRRFEDACGLDAQAALLRAAHW